MLLPSGHQTLLLFQFYRFSTGTKRAGHSNLEDHKAGAGLAIGLLQAMEARHDDKSLSQFARSILIGVEEDEKTLQILAKEIGTGSNLLKEAAAWVGEKASRVKLGAGLSGDFGTFEALL